MYAVLGLLGHNGAGKTTAQIGLAGQYATVDGLLTARANIELAGRLYHLPRAQVSRRADQLLERVGLADDADDLVKTFSGGMRRRLDLAASLVASPPVLFLDEPTTGLDPQSRGDLWALLRELVADGATLVLTTQYLEEADRLADEIVVLDHGRVVAAGSPMELKRRIGGERIEVTAPAASDLEAASYALDAHADGPMDINGSRLVVPIREGTRLMDVVRALDSAGVDAIDVNRREATLDDVFLTLTGSGRAAAPEPTEEVAA
jgi:ABC-2 type transport system ATP-binding protein